MECYLQLPGFYDRIILVTCLTFCKAGESVVVHGGDSSSEQLPSPQHQLLLACLSVYLLRLRNNRT